MAPAIEAAAGPRVRMMTMGVADSRTGRPLLAVVRIDDHGRAIEEVRITEPMEWPIDPSVIWC